MKHEECLFMEKVEKVMSEMVVYQKDKLLFFAKKIVPHIAPEDLLQPQDFPELDFHPEFRHEEGYLEGLERALAAVRRIRKESEDIPQEINGHSSL